MKKVIFPDEIYKNIFYDNSQIVIIVNPETGFIIDANNGAEKFYQWTTKEMKLMKVSDINMLSDKEVFEEITNAKNNRINFFHFRHKIKDGTVKNVKVESIPFESNGTQLLCSIIEDVTDNKEKKIVLRGEYCKEIFKNASRGIIIFEITHSLNVGKFLDVNDHITLMLGYSKQELFDMSILDLFEEYELGDIFNLIKTLKIRKRVNEIRKIKLKGNENFLCDVEYNYFDVKHKSYVQMFVMPYVESEVKNTEINHDSYCPKFKIDRGYIGVIEISNFNYIRDYYGKEISRIVFNKIAIDVKSEFNGAYEIDAFNNKIYIATSKNKSSIKKDWEKFFSKYLHGIEINENIIYLDMNSGFSEFNGDITDSILESKESLKKIMGSYEKIEIFSESKLRDTEKYILRNDLHFAVKSDELFIEYQGIYNIESQRINGLEALVRWNHKKYGIIEPDNFIPNAEKDSLIFEIDLWVLKKVISDLEKMIKQEKDFYVNVNISPKNFLYPSFLDTIEKIMIGTNFPYGAVVFELTESSNLNIDLPMIKRLKKLGIKIALDDFGTGFASLSQLKILDIDIIKIDMSFIREINKDLNSTLITLAILNMAKSLKIEVIAEGIETEEQFKFLAKNNCANIQGFLIHKPEKIEKILVMKDNNFQIQNTIFSNKMNFESKMKYSDQYKFGDLIYQTVSCKGILKNVNERFSNYLGYYSDELENVALEDLFDLDYKEMFAREFSGKNISGESFFIDKFFRIIGKDNAPKFALVSAKKDSFDEKLVHMFFEDISEQMEIGENIQKMKFGYERIFQESPVSVIVMNENLEVLDLNKKAESVFGWKKEEVLGNYLLRYFIKSEDFHLYKNIMDNVLLGEESENLTENLTNYGRKIFCHWYNKPIKNSLGEVKLIIAMVKDVTYEIKREKHLIMLEAAIEQSSAVMIIVDINGRIEYVNKKYCEVSGFLRKEVIGKNIRTIRTDIQDKNMFVELWNNLKKSEEWNGEINYRKKGGESFWTRTKIFPVFDSEGNKINYISINDDITEEREITEKFNKINRTLIEQEKMASVGQMAAGIVHEINNPLSYISSNIFSLKEMMKEDINILSGDEFLVDLKDIVNDIQEGIDTIKEIAQGLKKFSFRNINVKEEKQLVNLNEEIRTTLIVAKNEYKYYTDIKFENKTDIYVPGYSGQLRQVFLNMIINAVYAIKKKFENGMGLIEISIYENADSAFVKFADNGIGIKEEYKERIFDPFFTTKEEGEGTGLGLNITRDIIKNNHGGDIFVDGKYGEGATFIIKIPKLGNELF